MRLTDFGNDWFEPELPPALPMAMRQFLDGIQKGTPILFDLERAIALTELLENAYLSDKEQRIVKVK